MSSFDLAYTKSLDLEIFKEISKVSEYLCPLCTGVYHNPVVDHCGHVFCRDCIKYWISSIGKTKICPISKTQYDSNIEDQIIHPLTVIQIIIEKLEVKCKNRCEWEGKLSEMFTHIRDKCPNSIIDCRNKVDGCNAHFIRMDRTNHEDVCEYRPGQCDNCEKSVPIISMSEHLEVCPNVRVECPQKREAVVQRRELENHVKINCENTRINCVFQPLGCEETFFRSSQKIHDVDNIDRHNQIVVSSVLETRGNLEKVTKAMEEFNTNLVALSNTVNNCNNSITDSIYEQLIDSYNKKRPNDQGLHVNNSNSRGIVPSKIASRSGQINTSNANVNNNIGNSRENNPSSGEKQNKITNDSMTQRKRERNVSSNNDSNSANVQTLLKNNFKGGTKHINSNYEENKFLDSVYNHHEDNIAPDDLEEFMSFNSNGLINKTTTYEKEKSIPISTANKLNHKAEITNHQNSTQISLGDVNSSNGVLITNNKAVNQSMARNDHKFIFANLFLDKTDAAWEVVITKKSGWIAVGCCLKETVIANEKKFASHMNKHGCFMISSNGYLWNTNNTHENNCEIEPQSSTSNFEIKTGDVIKFSYKSSKHELTISLKEYKINLTFVNPTADTHLVPCVVFLNYGDEVSFTY